MSTSVPLSVLDLASVTHGSSEAEALHRSLVLAQHAETLGYHRFWTAEHHSMPSIASTAPDLIAMRIADATSRIRVGAGGVMLPNHAPLQVAERYLTLEAFHPGRIDLGLGRAPGTDGLAARALRRSDADGYAGQVAELEAFLDNGFLSSHPYGRITAMPRGVSRPPIFLLGSSLASAQLAAARGYAFAFAGHFSPTLAVAALRTYRDQFTPGATFAPRAILALTVIAAETDEQAKWVARSSKLSFLRFARGASGPVPSPEDAAAYPWDREEIAAADAFAAGHIIGDRAAVGHRLRALLTETGADELMVTATIHGLEDRKRSLQIIADAMAS